MKYSSTLVTLAIAGAGAGASPAPAATTAPPPPPPIKAPIYISDFSINAASLAADTIYSLKASYSGVSSSPKCSYTDKKKGTNSFCAGAPPVAGFAPRDCNSEYNWAIQNGTDPTVKPARKGYVLSMIIDKNFPGETLYGCYFLPQSQFKCSKTAAGGGSADEAYTGPTSFSFITSDSPSSCPYKITS